MTRAAMASGKIQFAWKDPDYDCGHLDGKTRKEREEFWKKVKEVADLNGVKIGEYLTIEIDLDAKTIKIL
jgi:hypothetical protein